MDTTNTTNLYEELSLVPAVKLLTDIDLSDGLAAGSISYAVLVCCSGMGLSLPYVCRDENARILTFQSFGHKCSYSAIAELLANDLVSNLIVYGHSNCEFTRFLQKAREQGSSEEQLLRQWDPSACEEVESGQIWRFFTGDNWLLMNELQVLAELKAVLQYPNVLARAESGKLSLHGWMYHEKIRKLQVYHPGVGRFDWV